MRSVCIFTLLCGAFEGLYKTFGGTTNKGKKKKKDIFLSSPVIRTGRVKPIYVVPSKSSKLFVEGSVH